MFRGDSVMHEFLSRPGMQFGPYLLFLRSGVAFSDFHDFEDWEPIGGAVDRQMWDGHNCVITMLSRPEEILALGDASAAPDWVEFLEIASIATEYSFSSTTNRHKSSFHDRKSNETIYYDEDDYLPTVANMMFMCEPGGTPEKATFDKRLIIISHHDADERANARVSEMVKRLVPTAEGVWHGSAIYALAARDQRSPAAILQALQPVTARGEVKDVGVFRLADAAQLRAPLSPLKAFLERRR